MPSRMSRTTSTVSSSTTPDVYHLALPLLIGLIAVALAFDFLNGLHDAANSIATVVGTRLIRPVWQSPLPPSSTSRLTSSR